MASLEDEIRKATRATASNPLNVADQGAYASVFWKSAEIKWSRYDRKAGPISRRCR
jgi:hypothetical protein